ncbi:hypothetical protein ACGFIF_14565 [Kribbella sp. NPDC049174]|uniref:hypothetical protein n=1 Tax=Kribbella sp. NPDC049174 TaxID=3364112 RepID=UPI00371727D4
MSHRFPGGAEQSRTPTEKAAADTQRRRVRVWFGAHVIAELIAVPASADRYAAAMDRRFAGLRITNDPIPGPAGAEQVE